MNSSKGFSLVELLGVMVVLGILLSMGIGAYTRYRKSAANSAYEIMSKNAASAAENYFMDHVGYDSVSFEELIDGNYLEPTKDPMFEGEICGGTVNIFDKTEQQGTVLESNVYKVIVNCRKHDSCNLYPADLECDPDGGIITDGKSTVYHMGLANYNFGKNMSLVIRVKFNKLADGVDGAIFGNWEGAGAGLALTPTNDFYFDVYSKSSSNYYYVNSSIQAKTNRWYVLVGVLDNGVMKLYLDGQLLGSTTLPGGEVKVSPYEFLVGGNPQPNGNILHPVSMTTTNALIFNRALTQQEITNYFSTPNMVINYTGSALVNKTF